MYDALDWWHTIMEGKGGTQVKAGQAACGQKHAQQQAEARRSQEQAWLNLAAWQYVAARAWFTVAVHLVFR